MNTEDHASSGNFVSTCPASRLVSATIVRYSEMPRVFMLEGA